MFSSNTSRVSADANYIEDVFQTWLYTGNSTTGGSQTITNNVDLSTKGGLVWIKGRSAASNHILTDTTRGAGVSASNNNAISSNLTSAEDLGASYDYLSAFSTTGFTVTQGGTTAATRGTNYDSVTYASWSFRKQAKFFDIVTYTGNGANRTITHNLGSAPGCIIVKDLTSSRNWNVYHRSLGNTKRILLNDTSAELTGTTEWNSTTPTATEFSLGTSAQVNANGNSYVAYLFAHDAGGFGLTGSDNVITCGSWTSAGTTTSVNLGYEPQWLLIKNASTADNWLMFDSMRGLTAKDSNDPVLYPNSSGAEVNQEFVTVKATGFDTATAGLNISGNTYIYIAIRRGPMKVPTDATKVFSPYVTSSVSSSSSGSTSTSSLYNPGFVTDTGLQVNKSGFDGWYIANRLTATNYLKTETDAGQVTSTAIVWDSNVGAFNYNSSYGLYSFRRAPGFFDVVCDNYFAGNVKHNLGVPPEFVIVKQRNALNSWYTWHSSFGVGTSSENVVLSSNAAKSSYSGLFQTMTATEIGIGNVTAGIGLYYVFATCPGVSKVGSYTGSGTTKQIDCGFTNGARFVLIKRTDSTGDWYVWDTARGIVSGNDPYLLLNSAAAEVTNTDYIDTYSAGFELSSTAPAALNANGGSYIFLAIA